MVFIFDFGFGQRGGIEKTPIDWLASAIDVALLHEVEESVGDGSFVVEAHSEVRVVPAAENAQALKVFFVLLDEAGCKLSAELAEFCGRDFAFASKFLFYLRFDWQGLAFPAGH